MAKLKFALIGCGRIAQRHAEHINNVGSLVAVCDIIKEKSIELANKFKCKSYFNIDDLLNGEPEIDIVTICTPNGLHCEHTIKCLRAGKHVICEKPMAIKSHECENMILEAEKAHKRLFIVKQNRYNPPVAELKKAINEDKLGDIFNVQLNCFWNRNNDYYKNSDWKGTNELDGGTLYTQFSHFIDLLLWLIGDINKVYVLRKNFMHQGLIEFEDTGVVAMEFFNRALGTINYTVNSYNHNMEGSLTVFGEKGTVKIGGQYLNVLEYQNIQDYKILLSKVSNKANDYGFYQGSMSNHDKVYENVVNVFKGKETITTNAIEGMKVVRVIENIYSQSECK